RTAAVYADGYAITNRYNLLGQLTNAVDSAGASVTNWFSNQGLLVVSSNAFGRISAASLDILDRPISVVDANGVSTTNTFDNLSRLLTHTYPDGGVEQFGYSPKGLTAYTSQLGQITRYAYDASGRRTAETNANNEVLQFAYNPAGDLLTLTDGKNQTTTLHYDEYGRATNKLDATGTEIFRYQFDLGNRLTNRWTAAKGNTAYSYDSLGN